MQNKSGILQKFSRGIAGTIFAASALVVASTSGYAATPTPSTTVYQAWSYGAEVAVGSSLSLGPVAVAEIPACTPTVESFTASAASANLPGVATTGVVQSMAITTLDSSYASSDVANIRLLGGLISASEIKAVSTSSESGGVFSSSSAGSIFSGVTVLGLPISANVAPNTKIELPGIGSVTLNEQTSFTDGIESGLRVNMLVVRITLGSQAGTVIVIGEALSSIETVHSPAAMGGYAYAPKLVAGPVTSGPVVLELVPCFGTSGVVETDSTADASVPGFVNAGAVTVTAEGNATRTGTSVQTTSSIAGINVLSGLVSASAITGNATGTTTDGVNFVFNGGSTLVGLVVEGFPAITDNPPPNTAVVIPNLGKLFLNHVEYAADHIRVVPIELEVNAANSLGLPIGADLTLGAVEASLHSSTVP